MKPTHLITLSARVEELYKLVCSGEITSIEFRNLTVAANWDLKTNIKLPQFVACDKNGVPLEKPIYTRSNGSFEGSFKYQKSMILYNEAQQEVVFEGWEVKKALETYYLECGDWQIDTYSKDGSFRLFNKKTMPFGNVKHILIQSLADLAEATTKNPIKLK